MAYTDITASSGRGIFQKADRSEVNWKRMRHVRPSYTRRLSQPAISRNYYNPDLISKEPDYRRSSVTTEPVYRRSSVTTEPVYKRSSVTTEPLRNISDLIAMESNQSAKFAEGETSRRRSSSDADDINWIQKYKKSDHHMDRLVNSRLEYQKAVGFSSETAANLQTSATTTFDKYRTSISQGPLTSSAHAPPPPPHPLPLSHPKPFRYEGTNRLTVYLQPTQSPSNYSPSSSYKKTYEPDRVTSQRSTQLHADIIPGRRNSMSSSIPLSRPVPLTSSTWSDQNSSSFQRRPSNHLSLSLSQSTLSRRLRRSSSVDSQLFLPKVQTSPSSSADISHHGYSHVVPLSESNETHRSSQFPVGQSYRPNFTRAPSLPPNLSIPLSTNRSTDLPTQMSSSSLLSGSGIGGVRSSFAGFSSDASRRRSSLANVSDLSTPNYRRSTDFGAYKSSAADVLRSAHLSAYGSTDVRRRGSYETLSTTSSLSPLSPLSPLQSPHLQSSSLPPPSERIFGARSTHSSLRRIRKSVADG